MSKFQKSLINAGYIQKSEDNLWINNSHKDIAYNDGDEVENRILQVIENANDLSSLSDELEIHCIDWPSSYHLSKRRANLIRPFSERLKGQTVLEVGSGMGAITRILGESGADVIALEGTYRRAKATRSRTRDLDNIDVVVEEFSKFTSEVKFDVITLIGVLEYANLFLNEENSHLEMLKRCNEMLNQNGLIIIAIENRLGLKYFAGAKEDHVGIEMFGIEDRYSRNSVKTFGKRELEELLISAGFPNSTFNSPLPDYKLTNTVIAEQGFKDIIFKPTNLIRESFSQDPQLPETLVFSPELAINSLISNNLGLDLSNSFLVIGDKQGNWIQPKNILAWHYSVQRKKKFCKETLFIREQNETYNVIKNNLSSLNQKDQIAIENMESICTQFFRGNTLESQIVCLLSTENWKHKSLLGLFQKYINEISKHIISGNIDCLNGNLIDLIPRNIIEDESGELNYIDEEWFSHNSLELGYLVFRAVINTVSRVSLLNLDEFGELLSPISVFDLINRELKLDISHDQLRIYIEKEFEFQSIVSPFNLDLELFKQFLYRPSARGNFNLLKYRAASFGQVAAERDQVAAERDQVAAERDQILKSRIWRFFYPYRKLRKFVLG